MEHGVKEGCFNYLEYFLSFKKILKKIGQSIQSVQFANGGYMFITLFSVYLTIST